MRGFLALTATLLVFGTAIGRAETLAPEAKIAKSIGNRVPGKPTDCISLRQIRSTQIIDRTAILYEMNNRVIYVNRPASGATFLRRDLALITDTHSPQLCSVDVVRLYDTSSKFESGTVGLGQFVPYRTTDRD